MRNYKPPPYLQTKVVTEVAFKGTDATISDWRNAIVLAGHGLVTISTFWPSGFSKGHMLVGRRPSSGNQPGSGPRFGLPCSSRARFHAVTERHHFRIAEGSAPLAPIVQITGIGVVRATFRPVHLRFRIYIAPSGPDQVLRSNGGGQPQSRKSKKAPSRSLAGHITCPQRESSSFRQKNVVLNSSCRRRACFMIVWNSGSS